MGYADTLNSAGEVLMARVSQAQAGLALRRIWLLVGLFLPVPKTFCTSSSGLNSPFLGRSSFSTASFFLTVAVFWFFLTTSFPQPFLLLFHCLLVPFYM